MKYKLLPVITFLGILIYSLNASAASLLGEHVYGCLANAYDRDCTADPFNGGNSFSPDNAVISKSEIEFNHNLTSPGFIREANFDDNNLQLKFGYQGNGLGGHLTGYWFFKLLDHNLKITDVKLVDSNTFINDMFFSEDSISIVTNTIDIKPGESLNWNFKVDVQPVPAPAALWLFGTGLISLFGLNRHFMKVK